MHTRTWWVLEGLFWSRFWEGEGGGVSSQLLSAPISLCRGLHRAPRGAWHPWKSDLPRPSTAWVGNRSLGVCPSAPTPKPRGGGGGQRSWSTLRCLLTQLRVLWVSFCSRSCVGKGCGLAAEGARCSAWDTLPPLHSVTIKAHEKNRCLLDLCTGV